MPTLNYNSGNNIIIPTENKTTYRGLEGNDTYIISRATEKNSKIDIIDTQGANTIQLVDGITISSSIFTSNAARLVLSNGTQITISGADKFIFEAGGNLTSATLGASRSYLKFAEAMGASYASFQTDKGDGHITINNSYDMRLIKNDTLKIINLNDYFNGENLKYTISNSEYPNEYNYLEPYISDQISLSGEQLKAQGGVGEEIYQATIKVKAENKDTGAFSEKEFTFRLTDDDDIKQSSSLILSSPDSETIISISEDVMGDRLLDLSSFKIDEGSAKITSVSIGGSVIPISYFYSDPWFQDGWADYFYVNENVLKFAQYSYYDYDTNEYKLFFGPDTVYGSDWQFHDLTTSNVRDNEFSIIFEYTTEGKSKTHKVIIDSFSNTSGGPIDAIPDGDRIKKITETSDNNINSLLSSDWQWAGENNSEITEITFAFPPSTDTDNVLPWVSNPSKTFWELADSRDTYIENEDFKDGVRSVLSMTEEMFKVKFTELNEDNYKEADLRYILFETSDSTASSQAWHPASENHSYIYLLTSYGGKYDDYSSGGVSYGTILHETGHALNLAHPFGGSSDGTKIESSQNTTLFSVMAYDAFWLRTTDTYGIATGNGSGLYKGNVADYENYLSYSSWDLHDIAALGHMYGYRTNYKSEDTIYTFSPSVNIYKTIHDMAGNDTINLSNYTDNTTISLIPGGVSEIGSNKLFWEGDNQQSGDYFVLSFKTDIENYIGSSGNDDVTLNTLVINDISTGIGDDVVRDGMPSDIIKTQAGDDSVYVTISELTEINSSIAIDGGPGYDWLIIERPTETSSSLDFNLADISSHFDNFEGFDFTNTEKNKITVIKDDFISGLKIKGDENDEITLPENASQTNSDDLYLYYTLNDVEIGISIDLQLI